MCCVFAPVPFSPYLGSLCRGAEIVFLLVLHPHGDSIPVWSVLFCVWCWPTEEYVRSWQAPRGLMISLLPLVYCVV